MFAAIEIKGSLMWCLLLLALFLAASLAICLPNGKLIRCVVGLPVAVLFGALLIATFDTSHSFEKYINEKWFTDEATADDKPATSSPSPPTAPADDATTTPVAVTPQPPRKVLADVEDVIWVEGSKRVTFPALPDGQWWVIMYEGNPPNGVVVVGSTYEHNTPLENVRVYLQEGDAAITFITPVTPRPPAAPPASVGSDNDNADDDEPADDPST